MSAWEGGEYLPGGEELYKLADFFGVTVDELLGRTLAKYPELISRAVALHDVADQNLIDDALVEVQTIKDSIAALERKIKKLKS